MRDVLGTIQADQDAIIRAGSRGALVVDGGPGTGKTVVALHRTAYLLYSDPRLGHRRGGVLFVGPHEPYLAYVADVLPSLGEEGVQTCTLRDLVAEGADRRRRDRPGGRPAEVVGRRWSTAIEPAVRFYEEPPTEGMRGRDRLGRRLAQRRRLGRGVRRARARHAAQRGARPGLGGAARRSWSTSTTTSDDDAAASWSAASLRQDARAASTTFNRAWPLLEATDLVGDLWSVPAYLRMCAPWLTPDEVRALQRDDAAGLDGRPTCRCSTPPGSGSATPRRPGAGAGSEAAVAAEREQMDAGHRRPHRGRRLRDGASMSMLRGQDLQDALRRRGRAARHRPGPARRPVRARRRRRGAGADRRRVADAAAALPVAQLHHRRRPRAGPARVHRVVAGAARAGRARPDRAGLAEHQLPDAGGGHGRGRAGDPRRAPGRQRADVDPQQRRPRRARVARPSSTRSSTTWLAAHAEGIACVIGDPTFAADAPASGR